MNDSLSHLLLVGGPPERGLAVGLEPELVAHHLAQQVEEQVVEVGAVPDVFLELALQRLLGRELLFWVEYAETGGKKEGVRKKGGHRMYFWVESCRDNKEQESAKKTRQVRRANKETKGEGCTAQSPSSSPWS
jgi:hypothetical protein